MTRNTIIRQGVQSTETRFFISSLPLEVSEVAGAIRGHWMVESYHWHLDVTFREDDNRTLDKDAAFNLNIIRKWALNILKLFAVGRKPRSMKKKRFVIGTNQSLLKFSVNQASPGGKIKKEAQGNGQTQETTRSTGEREGHAGTH